MELIRIEGFGLGSKIAPDESLELFAQQPVFLLGGLELGLELRLGLGEGRLNLGEQGQGRLKALGLGHWGGALHCVIV